MHRSLGAGLTSGHGHIQALKHVEIDAELQRFLLRPQREIHVELVITMDSGEVESFNAYRVQHNNFRGPYKGGYRLAPDVDMQEMRRWFSLCLSPLDMFGQHIGALQ